MIQDQHLGKVLETVRTHKEAELPAAILEAKDWCHLYHLSAARTNLIEWIEIEKDEELLEIGAECGALTGLLSERAKQVTALELDPVKTEINRTRHRDAQNIRYLSGTFQELKENCPVDGFDKIFMVGSLPLAELYLGKSTPEAYEELLQEVRGVLKGSGSLILALPNRLGLKYFAGCREDYFGAPFTGLEDYYYHKGMRTFGKRELSEMLARSGFSDFSFYYPYPDYRFMTQLFSDQRLPEEGELHTNLVNFDQSRYVFFDETKVYDGLTREGLFPQLSNSFLVITGKAPTEDLVYAKYSYEREERFVLRTDLLQNRETKRRYAKKTPLHKDAAAHVQGIAALGRALSEAYRNTGITICECEGNGDSVTFPFVTGGTLQKKMEALVLSGQQEELLSLIQEYSKRLQIAADEPFHETDEFREVFGEAHLPGGLLSAKASDIDLIFSNILLTPEGEWKAIDYEWTFLFPVPVHFVLYRAYFFACHQIQPCAVLSLPELLQKEGIGEEEQKQYEGMEAHFQSYVTGGRMQERDLLALIGNEILALSDMDRAYHEKTRETEKIRKRPGFFSRQKA